MKEGKYATRRSRTESIRGMCSLSIPVAGEKAWKESGDEGFDRWEASADYPCTNFDK